MSPVATCICVTQNRRFFLRQAIRYFERANHGAYAELVIVDGSPEPFPMSVNGSLPRLVRYFHEPSAEHARTGYFHNRACELARGRIIIQWDDDDWHSPARIVSQVRTLDTMFREEGVTGITFTSKFYWYHLLEKQAAESRTWYVGESSVGAMFAYHRRAWERIPFRDVPQGEDNYFFDDHKAAGTPMVDTQDPTMCLYVRHNRNGSPLVQANYQEQATDEARELLLTANDLSFYDELAEIMPREPWNRPHPMATSPYAMHMQVMQARTRRK